MNGPRLFLFILILPAVWGLLEDVANLHQGGSIDLRNRITGARVAAAGVDPYAFKWQPGDAPEFLDLYNEPASLLSKTTVTPWVLAWHTPMNEWNYRVIQWCWLGVSYLALIAALWVWARGTGRRAAGWGLVFALAFAVTPAWRHHVDRGQVYAVYAAWLFFLPALMKPGRGIIGGLGGAGLVASRPVYLAVVAAAGEGRWRWILGALVAGALVTAFVPMLLFGESIWSDYRLAMETHAEQYLNEMKAERLAIPYPAEIEGIPIETLAGFSREIPFTDTSVFRWLPGSIPAKLPIGLWMLCALGFFGWLIWMRSRPALIWWMVAAWAVIGDFFLPAFRHTYNDVLALPLLLFGLAALDGHPARRWWIGGSLAVLLAMSATWWAPSSSTFLIGAPSGGLLVLALASVGIAGLEGRRAR